MPSQTIQWFPGHMAKTRRMITENLGNVDAVIEVRDARIPRSSANPEVSKLTSGKPRLILLNKASLADPEESAKWISKLSGETTACLLTDCIKGTGMNAIPQALRKLCSSKIERFEEKGMSGRHLRVMVIGIPNVGKSSLINRLAGGKKARVEDRPGVTRDKQWVPTEMGFDLLDMPGVLWPKFDEKVIGENLAVTGAIKDTILDVGEISVALVGRLRVSYPDLLATRYKLEPACDFGGIENWELFEMIGKKRGFLLRGGEINYDRTSAVLLDEFRSGTIGRITLDPAE